MGEQRLLDLAARDDDAASIYDVLDAVDAGRNVDERAAAVSSVDNLVEALRNG